MAWHSKDYYGFELTNPTELTQAQENADEIGRIFTTAGFTINAISVLVGCFYGEAKLNPWCWEEAYSSAQVPSYSEYQNWSGGESANHGYGLPQFTPASEYIANAASYNGYAPHFRDITGNATDGEAQSQYIADTIEAQWFHADYLYNYYAEPFAALDPPIDISAGWNLSFTDFKTNESIDLETLTLAYLLNYGRGAAAMANRFYPDYYSDTLLGGGSRYWYEYFTGHPPTPGPSPSTAKKMPLWMMLKRQIY